MAKVWAGKANLRSTIELWRRYDEVVTENIFNTWVVAERKVITISFVLSLIFFPQLHCDFPEAGLTLMLSNMVGGR